MRLTQKQVELLYVLTKKNPDGSELDIDQLTEALTWKPSKASLQFSLRALIAHGLIVRAERENRRNRLRTIIKLTELGQHFYHVKNNTNPMLVSVEVDELENLVSPASFPIDINIK